MQNSASYAQNNAVKTAENTELDRENVPKDVLPVDSTQINVDENKSTLSMEANARVLERKISKFTVLKVDASALTYNVNTNVSDSSKLEGANLIANEKPIQSSNKTSSHVKEVKFAIDVQSKNENNLNNNSTIQDESLSESIKDSSKQQNITTNLQVNQQQNVQQIKSNTFKEI